MNFRSTGNQLAKDGQHVYTFTVSGSQRGSAKAHILPGGELWVRYDYTRTIGHYIFAAEDASEQRERHEIVVPEIVETPTQYEREDKQRERITPDEQRIDPDDGKIYTYAEFFHKHRSAFSAKDIREYWLSQCAPSNVGANFQNFSGKQRSQCSSGPRKRDPDDGKFYTYEELVSKYAQAWPETKIKKYWAFECTGS